MKALAVAAWFIGVCVMAWAVTRLFMWLFY